MEAVENLARATKSPVFIQLLGPFGLLKNGQCVPIRSGGRTEGLLCALGLRYGDRVPREVVLSEVWPEADPVLAGQSLNTLTHSLHRLVGDVLHGLPPVLHVQGSYQLNLEAGVSVDTASFEALAKAGDRAARTDASSAIGFYECAISLYRGDLHTAETHQALIERERLRALYLTVLARLATHHYRRGNLDASMQMALRLLNHDPCREDAHRIIMRCHVLRGERTQALRQYQLCARLLRSELDVAPEPTTMQLVEQIRLDPGSV